MLTGYRLYLHVYHIDTRVVLILFSNSQLESLYLKYGPKASLGQLSETKNQEETASLALSEGKKTHLQAPLKLNNEHITSCLFNLFKKKVYK